MMHAQVNWDAQVPVGCKFKLHLFKIGVLELLLKFPCDMKSANLTLEFDKGFLHIDEYPPEANQGFDIPSAVITFLDFQSNLGFLEGSNLSPLISRLQEKSPSLAYTEVLLVSLTTPDFSMPYNVITITCTVFALYFGSLLNVLRRRAGEEERLLKDGDKKIDFLIEKLKSVLTLLFLLDAQVPTQAMELEELEKLLDLKT